jgi:hypothetical protein
MTTANYDYTDELPYGEIVARHDMVARWSNARYQIVQLRSPKRAHDVWLHLCISNGETLSAEFAQHSLAEAEDYVHRCDRSVIAYGEAVENGAYVLSPNAGSPLTRAAYEAACAAIEATQWPDTGRVSVMTPPSAHLTSNTDADDAGRVLAARRRAGIAAEVAR